VLACVLVAVGLMAATPASAASRFRGPHLEVTRLIINGLGRNPYLVVPHSGVARNIKVKVVTTNVGHATSSPSRTWVFLFGKRHAEADPEYAAVPSLAPRRSHTARVVLKDVMPHLGLDKVKAYADCNLSLKASSCNGPRVSPPIPVIARTWDVQTMTAETTTAQFSDQSEQAQLGFFFRFKSFYVRSGRFYYSATGSVAETATVHPNVNGCSGSGADSVGHAPWPMSSNLWINFGLTKYQAHVFASNEPPFTVQITCPSFPPSSQDFNYLDLQTGSSPKLMYTYGTQIFGAGATSLGLSEISDSWHLVADVP
jgi:hypothetical protein